MRVQTDTIKPFWKYLHVRLFCSTKHTLVQLLGSLPPETEKKKKKKKKRKQTVFIGYGLFRITQFSSIDSAIAKNESQFLFSLNFILYLENIQCLKP